MPLVTGMMLLRKQKIAAILGILRKSGGIKKLGGLRKSIGHLKRQRYRPGQAIFDGTADYSMIKTLPKRDHIKFGFTDPKTGSSFHISKPDVSRKEIQKNLTRIRKKFRKNPPPPNP